MSSDFPSLPNEAPVEDMASESAPVELDPPEVAAPPEPLPAPVVASRPVIRKPEPAPRMPAMPGEPAAADDDDDDFEIPDEEEVQRIVSGDQSAPEDTPEGVIQGVIVTLRPDGALVDVGEKAEAFLPITLRKGDKPPDWSAGDTIEVTASRRGPDGNLILSSSRGERPGDWDQLEAAYETGAVVVGKVLEIVKGGLAVDVGARAFLPASRSGEPDQEKLEALVGQDIRARIVQLDLNDRNVVLDRGSVVDDERSRDREEALSKITVGSVMDGVVRTIRDFGAFVDLGGVDALLHVSDIAWSRVDDVRSVLEEGQKIQVKVLKVGDEGRRISVGKKQLEAEPWSAIDGKYQVGDRITGQVTRIKDYGAFVEIVPGVEGLIHVSEMSWARRVRHPKDIVDVGDTVDAVILDLNVDSRRIGLGLKQALGDPWDRLEQDSPVGAVLSGEVKKTTNFGAFVEVAEGVEGLLHVSDITSERRLNHTNEVLKVGDTVRVKVLEINRERRRLKLGIKQLEPTEVDRYMETVQAGDTVSGRVVRLHAGHADVELDEGVRARCALGSAPEAAPAGGNRESGKDGVSSLSAKLEQAWKGGAGNGDSPLQEGELRSFQVVSLDAESGSIELSLS